MGRGGTRPLVLAFWARTFVLSASDTLARDAESNATQCEDSMSVCFHDEMAVSLLQVGHVLAQNTASVAVRSSSIPDDVDFVRRVWVSKGAQEKEQPLYGQPFPGDMKFVLGVLCMATDISIRSVIRSTWMNQSGVCPLNSPSSANCTVYAGFVIGAGHGSPSDDFDDLMLLDMPENMNEGKSWKFFNDASVRFPWATHIGKMDTDAYPYFHLLIPRMVPVWRKAAQDGCGEFYGMAQYLPETDPIFCRTHYGEICPPVDCGPPLNGSFLRFRHETGTLYRNDTPVGTDRCRSFMQGGFYVMSTQLARNVTCEGCAWEQKHVGPEDVLAGYAVTQYAWSTNSCVATWEGAGVHNTSRYNSPPRDMGWEHISEQFEWDQYL